MAKDVSFVVQTADALNSPTPAARTLRDAFAKAVEAGLDEKDFAAIATTLGFPKQTRVAPPSLLCPRHGLL